MGRRRELEPPPYDLGPTYNRHTAFYVWPLPADHPCAGVYDSGWKACYHGCSDVPSMKRCGCDVCGPRAKVLEAEERRNLALCKPPPERKPPPARVVDIGPVRAVVVELLEGGMSRTELAVEAGIDRSTVGRVLRPDARRVSSSTADSLLALRPVNGS